MQWRAFSKYLLNELEARNLCQMGQTIKTKVYQFQQTLQIIPCWFAFSHIYKIEVCEIWRNQKRMLCSQASCKGFCLSFSNQNKRLAGCVTFQLGKEEIKNKQHNNKNKSIYLYTCRPFMNANGEDDHGTTSKLQGEMRRRWFSDAGC